MKKLVMLLTFIGVSIGLAQFPVKTIQEIQTVPMDSLILADSLGIGSTRYLLQTSPFFNPILAQRETIAVVALVTVPPKVITYTAGGKTMCLRDTGVAFDLPWSGIFVRYPGDSSSADADGLYNVERGDIIKITGLIGEFPAPPGNPPNMNSYTQFEPLVGFPIEILSNGNPIPKPVSKSISDFNIGANPGGKVVFSKGEPYEAMEVEFTNLTVTAIVNPGRGTWAITDENGNMLSDYDWSYYFTIGHGSIETPGDPNYKVPPVGTKIDTLRGYVATSSGQESNRGYRICPIYVGDVVYGKIAPAITTHRRNPVIVGKDSTPSVSAKIYKQTSAVVSGANILSQELFYSVNNGAWQQLAMPVPGASDSVSAISIPAQTPGSMVKYFIKVTDTDSLVTILANSGSLTQYDSSKGFFFYTVIDRSVKPVLAPSDIQTTAYINGRSPYIGAIDSVGGIVTADTSALRVAPLSDGGTSTWFIQSGNAPFSGLWVVGTEPALMGMQIGDSVVVTGSIQENFEVTRLANVTGVRIVASGKSLPEPLNFKTERFGDAASNGNFNAEPYEGMLVKFDSVEVTNIFPVFSEPTEYWISNSSQAIIVRRDGRNTYSNVPADTAIAMNIVKVGDEFSSVTGIIHFSGGRYKVAPRTNNDYTGFTGTVGVRISRGNTLPDVYALAQNYPNPFNPATTLRYAIPQASHVVLTVYNVIGQEVATLVNEHQTSGVYTVSFDASKLATGMYLYRITAGNFVQTKKMILVK